MACATPLFSPFLKEIFEMSELCNNSACFSVEIKGTSDICVTFVVYACGKSIMRQQRKKERLTCRDVCHSMSCRKNSERYERNFGESNQCVKYATFICVRWSAQISVFVSKKIKRIMQQVCHSERSAAKSKNLRNYSYICGEIGAKILRLPSVAQDDTIISTVPVMKADIHN